MARDHQVKIDFRNKIIWNNYKILQEGSTAEHLTLIIRIPRIDGYISLLSDNILLFVPFVKWDFYFFDFEKHCFINFQNLEHQNFLGIFSSRCKQRRFGPNHCVIGKPMWHSWCPEGEYWSSYLSSWNLNFQIPIMGNPWSSQTKFVSASRIVITACG